MEKYDGSEQYVFAKEQIIEDRLYAEGDPAFIVPDQHMDALIQSGVYRLATPAEAKKLNKVPSPPIPPSVVKVPEVPVDSEVLNEVPPPPAEEEKEEPVAKKTKKK